MWSNVLRRINRKHSAKKQSELYKPRPQSVEVIGATDLAFGYSAFNSGKSSCQDLTQTIIDFTTHATQARILLTNSTGATRYLESAAIYGKKVECFSGEEGWIHDAFVDEDSIYRNGEIKLEIGNSYIVTLAQGNQLADYWWKKSRTARHEYTVIMSGTRIWYMPGDHYTIQIGSAGQREYIDSVVECTSNKCERKAGEIGHTVLRFEEVLANWVFDSNATARFLSRGGPGRNPIGDEIIVAASNFHGSNRDFTCDGTADNVDIQAAIDRLSGRGGGVVRLTEGTFYIAAKLAMRNNVFLLGRGVSSIITKNFDDYAIEAAGTSDAYMSNFGIGNLKVTQIPGDTNANYLIRLYYAKDFSVNTVWISYHRSIGIYAAFSSGGVIKSCVLDNTSVISSGDITGITIGGNGVIVIDNTIQDATSSGGLSQGISVLSGSTAGCLVVNNVVRNLKGITTDTRLAGISLGGERTICQGNIIDDIRSISDINYACGIASSGEKNQIINNQVTNTGWHGIDVVSTAEDTIVSNNILYDNGNLLDHGACEAVDAPHIIGDGASVTQGTFARSSDRAYAGSYSFKHTITSALISSEARMTDNADTTDLHGLIAGLTYAFSGYIYVAGGEDPADFAIRLAYYDGAVWTTETASPDSSAAWKFLSVQTTIPATATGAYAYVRIDNASAENDYCYWDQLRLYPTGLGNVHSNNFYDAGTGTQIG